MSRGQKLPGQMLPLQLESVLDVHRNLPLKFHKIESVTAEILRILSLCGVEWGEISKVILLSNPTVVLGWAGVLTKIQARTKLCQAQLKLCWILLISLIGQTH